MFDPNNIPPVENDELLARYATQSNHFRSSDKLVKKSLFLPHPYQELSVTRHREAIDDEIWLAGYHVAAASNRTLYGRADIRADDCKIDTLRVVAEPTTDNPNHADIAGWPSAKQDQISLAQKLAAVATNLITPPSTL